MGLLSVFSKSKDIEKTKSEISSIIPVCENCSCSEKDAQNSYPSITRDDSSPLWHSADPVDIQIVIPTGTTDWPHDIADDKSSLAARLKDYFNDHPIAHNVKIVNSSLGKTDFFSSDDEMLIFPAFIKVSFPPEQLKSALDALFASKSPLELSIPNITVSSIPYDAIILLCSHRKRDKRCGITAPILKKEIDSHLLAHDLYRDASDDRPGGATVVFVSHVGGHKFAANALIYKRSGERIWLARCDPKHAKIIVEETVMGGKVPPELVRAVACGPAISW